MKKTTGPLRGAPPNPPTVQRREPRGVEPTRRFAKDVVREKRGKSAEAGKDLDSLLEKTINMLGSKPRGEIFDADFETQLRQSARAKDEGANTGADRLPGLERGSGGEGGAGRGSQAAGR